MRRPGYTLLEVLLAVAIGMLVVAALYVAMDLQLRYAQTGRNAVAEGQLARGLLARMGADVRLSLAMLPSRNANASTTTTAPTSGGTDAASEEPTTSFTPSQFNYGIVGDETQITLFVSSMPRYARADSETQSGASDLSRITYWLAPGEGLARLEIRNVAGGDLASSDAPATILASEVVDLYFRYYDPVNASWLTSWDGTTSGPPLAVEITLTLRPLPDQTMGRRIVDDYLSTYRLVVSIPTGNVPADDVGAMQAATSSRP